MRHIDNITKGYRYSIPEVARILQVNKRTVYRYIEQRLIRAGIKRSNKRMFVEGGELKRFLLTDNL